MNTFSFKHFVFLFLLVSAISCSKDLGTYKYHDINEVSINGFDNEYSVITVLDTLKINPIVDGSINRKDTSAYDYYWIIKIDNFNFDTIGRYSTLNYPVNYNPGSYNFQFRVVDKETGIAWWKYATLNIGTPFSKGILLIGINEENNAEAEMISMVGDTALVYSILSNSGLPTLNGPIDFFYTSGRDKYRKVWILTQSGSYYLDRMSMKGDVGNRFGKQVYTTDPIDLDNLNPIAIAPQIANASGKTSNDNLRAVMCSDGNIFTSYLLLNGGDYYTNAMNRISNQQNKLIKAAPFMMYSIGNMNSITWYDTENNRFLNINNIGLSTSSSILKDADGDVFPWNQDSVKRTLVYAENTRNTDGGSVNGNSFAVMKDAAGEYYVYEFYGYNAVPAKRAMYKILPIAANFDHADFYAFSSNRTVIFYAADNRLYAYDYNPGHEKFYTYPELNGDEISMLKFDTQMDYVDNSLYIATYNSNYKGRLRRFRVGNNPNTVDLIPVENADWSGLIKVKNMNWRSDN